MKNSHNNFSESEDSIDCRLCELMEIASRLEYAERSRDILSTSLQLGGDDRYSIEEKTTSAFFDGQGIAAHTSLLKQLETKYPDQQAAAESIGLRNRTSISHMKRTGKISGYKLINILAQNPEFGLPTSYELLIHGLSNAANYVRTLFTDPQIDTNLLTPQKVVYLTRVLARIDWEESLDDPYRCRNLAVKIVMECNLGYDDSINPNNHRSEELVRFLQRLLVDWCDPVVVTLHLLGDRIPSTLNSQRILEEGR